MNKAPIVDNMTRGWNRDPTSLALGNTRTELSSALWTHDVDDVQEVTAEPDPEQHIISVQQCDLFADLRKDGRHIFARTVRRGEISIIEAGVRPHAVHKGRWSVLHLYLPDALIQDIAKAEPRLAGRKVQLIDPACSYDRVIDRIGRDVLSEMRGGLALSRLRIDVLGQELAIQLIRAHSDVAGVVANGGSSPGGLAPWQVRRVSDYLEAHLAGDVALADLAALVQLSPSHLCRAFKQSTGLPPHRWRIAQRVERAREMLEQTDLPVTEIAARVGYDDPGQFAAAFRKTHNVSPTRYRRERKR